MFLDNLAGGRQGTSKEAFVFDIQRYSIQDGPGIRTTVFFKGCPLRCLWCSNPESQSVSPQLLYFQSLCTKCYHCVALCTTGASKVRIDGTVEINRSLCSACGTCVRECSAEARRLSGKPTTVEEVMEVLKKDTLFYRTSGGGVTFSGGEPTFQPDFLFDLSKRCIEEGFHTCLETCGHVKWKVLERVLEHIDLVLYDIKHTDSERHRQLTGVGNELIMENARRIASKGMSIVLRVPLIPGYNDSQENIVRLAEFASDAKIPAVDVLPYHQFGLKKYHALGVVYQLADVEPYDKEKLLQITQSLECHGLKVTVI